MGKRKKKCKNKCEECCDFSNYELPPCAKFLGNSNPIIHDGEIIYRNINRLYFF